ncbi:MAG: DUF1801 domain-containing protein [Bacteroidota bacterium]
MANLKTQPYNRNISEFLSKVENPQKREDCFTLLDLMKEETGEEPQYWHSNMVGFGQYHYKYASGQEGDWFLTGFSPRKQNLTIYIMSGFERYEELMEQLGRYKTGKSCLYVKRLSDIDLDILKELVRESVSYMREEYK